MAVFNCNFHSDILGYDTQVKVILPELILNKGEKYQVLYLLHGLGDDCNAWSRFTSIERYALEHKIAVVMPTGENSFYTNMAIGKRYFDYMSQELPFKMLSWFPLSDKKEDTFIAGLSMGGYGTLKLALTFPERFCAAAFLSAAVEPRKLKSIDRGSNNESYNATHVAAFGEEIKDIDIPEYLLKVDVLKRKQLPMMIQYIGRQDFLYDMNQDFKEMVKEANPLFFYEEWDGAHNWVFWDTAIQKALNLFPLKGEAVKCN